MIINYVMQYYEKSEHLVRIWLDLISMIYNYSPKYASKVVNANYGVSEYSGFLQLKIG